MTIGDAIFYIFLILFVSAIVGGVWWGLYKIGAMALGVIYAAH